ncbi:MAG TPA: Asp23/Gls24 family envelope stress response protein [Spirochaetota bacterium]|nr:Asp23/Gls24 family envelope stress response protein [Spirochaetota bacterium]
MANFFENLMWGILPKKVYGLVGSPGTGKSFRAFLLAEKYKIQFIIDDGLLIKGQQILAGKSAKREKYHVAAVKRAIFQEPKHAREVRRKLIQEKYRSVLILGTSENMLHKIIERLHLPKPFKIIKIEDISTEEEIRNAQKNRLKYGKHVIPIPLIEVKKKYPNLVLHAIHMFVDEPKGFFFKKNTKRLIEKTIVRPNFGQDGNISISETAIVQMVSHCIAEYSTNIKLVKVSVIEENDGFSLKLELSVDYMLNTPEVFAKIQGVVKDNIEQFTGIPILKVDIDIVEAHNYWGS